MGLAANAPGAAIWPHAEYERITKDGAYIVTVAHDSGVQGFIVAHDLGEEIEIENIAVAKEHRRKGLGAALLSVVTREAESRGSTSLILEVRESNIAARNFYENHGFSESGRRRGYYAGPVEDALLYRKKVGTAALEKA
jgi:ribosomal-protein-alanine acetyltransferase